MTTGEVFYGEFTLTNYGLIRADNVNITLPENDPYMNYEIMGGIPESIEAKEVIVVPFRVVALKAFDPSVATDGTGGGCNVHVGPIVTTSTSNCANGTVTTSTTSTSTTFSYGICGGGAELFEDPNGYVFSFSGTNDGTVYNNSYSPTSKALSGSKCIPICTGGNGDNNGPEGAAPGPALGGFGGGNGGGGGLCGGSLYENEYKFF